MRGRRIGARIVVCAALLAGASEAQADVDTFFVDTTSDASVTGCTAAAADCSLRGAFANADDGDAVSDIDSIIFDAQIFEGGGTATTVMASTGLVSDENLNLQALCSTTHPCAGIDGPPGDIAIKVQDGVFSMQGVAIFGGNTGLQHSNTADGLTLANDWFGLTLNGTTSGNDIGVYLAGPHVDIGGSGVPANVFTGNRLGLQMVGGNAADIDVVGNMFGVKADGATVAANSAADIDVSGNLANQAPSGVLIGGVANGTPECDGGCNVIAAAGGHGIDMSGSSAPGTFTSTAANIDVNSNHIGLNAAGSTSTASNGAILVRPAAADNIDVTNNRMAGGANAVNAGSGALSLKVEANQIGLSSDGTAVLDGTTETSIAVNSSDPSTPSRILNNDIAEDVAVTAISMGGSGGEVSSNRIGLAGVTGSGGLAGIHLAGGDHLVQGNAIGNVTGAIDLSENSGSEIKDNSIGELGPVGGDGILINSAPDNSTGNAIGSNDPELGNVFGDIGGDAIRVQGDGNDGNQILANTGGDADGLFIDLEGANGPGNGLQGPNAAVNAPKVKQITATAISGTAGPSGQVRIYRSTSPKGDFPEGLKKLVGTKDVKPDGTWKLKVPGKGVKKSWVVTANQTDSAGNGSELSKGKSRK